MRDWIDLKAMTRVLGRVLMVFGIAGITAVVLRLKGNSELAMRRGAWRDFETSPFESQVADGA